MKTAHLQVSADEFTIILGALREARAAIQPEELCLRVGGDAAAIARLSLKVRDQGKAQGIEE